MGVFLIMNLLIRQRNPSRIQSLKKKGLYILKQFFQVDGKRPRSKKISSIKPFPNASVFTLGSAIDDLKQKNLLILRGDLGSLTKEGIDFFNKHK